MANMATASLIYRKTASSGAPEVQTLATLKTDLGLSEPGLNRVINAAYMEKAEALSPAGPRGVRHGSGFGERRRGGREQSFVLSRCRDDRRICSAQK